MAELDTFRGRRLEACRAAEMLHDVIENIGTERDEWDWEHNGPKLGWTSPSELMRSEMQNSVANLLRMILIANDGQVARQTLNRF